MRAAGPLIRVRAYVSIAADQSAQVATPIVGRLERSRGESTGAHQLVVCSQVRPPEPTLLATRDVLPAAIAEKPMVAAGDELCAVLESDSVCRLERRPVVENAGGHETAVDAASLGAVDLVADSHLRQWFCPSVG